jgi:hypothetical protein
LIGIEFLQQERIGGMQMKYFPYSYGFGKNLNRSWKFARYFLAVLYDSITLTTMTKASAMAHLAEMPGFRSCFLISLIQWAINVG